MDCNVIGAEQPSLMDMVSIVPRADLRLFAFEAISWFRQAKQPSCEGLQPKRSGTNPTFSGCSKTG